MFVLVSVVCDWMAQDIATQILVKKVMGESQKFHE